VRIARAVDGSVTPPPLQSPAAVVIFLSRTHFFCLPAWSRHESGDFQESLLGTWRLKSIEGILPKRALFSMGPKPRGLLIYAPTGYMAAQIVRDPGPSFPAGYEGASRKKSKTRLRVITPISASMKWMSRKRPSRTISKAACAPRKSGRITCVRSASTATASS
jgi:hypothetical protein